MSPNIPEIDFVITWVDGNDPAWLKERARYSGEGGDQSEARFRDWDLLRYWFRGVETYAPWVRKIHFVTWGHIPAWLNTDNPKLHIVRHEDYIPAEYLPTFNSHTIELNMHRIEGLAEHFVYFNDDFFLTDSVEPTFFYKNGMPRICFGLDNIYFGSNSIGWIYGSCLSVINDHFRPKTSFRRHWMKYLSCVNGCRKTIKTLLLLLCTKGYFPGFFHAHLTYAFTRQTFEEVWAAAGDVLDETCRCKFREKTNVAPNLFRDWQLASGKFEPCSMKRGHCYHLNDNRVPKVCAALKSHSFAVTCINDTDRISNPSAAFQEIRDAFEQVLPNASSFER